jgi:hypothetical protein
MRLAGMALETYEPKAEDVRKSLENATDMAATMAIGRAG